MSADSRSGGVRVRPTRYFQPGAVAGSGSVLWVLDTSRPLLLRRDEDANVTTHEIPGEIRSSRIVGWRQRWMHADESGCWVVGADGVTHCDHSGEIRLIDGAPVAVSALVDGVLATARTGDRDTDGSAVIRLRTLEASGGSVVAKVPGDVDDIRSRQTGFLVSMRVETRGGSTQGAPRGQWCARVDLDGRVVLGDPWPRGHWGTGEVTVVDMGGPVAVARSRGESQILNDRLTPIARMAYTSAFSPYSTVSGTWLVQRASTLAHLGLKGLSDERNSHVYFRLNPYLTAPSVWAAAEGFPKDLTITEGNGRLWIVTTDGLFASSPGASGSLGSIEMSTVRSEELPVPEIIVRPPCELGDPERWAETERERLLEENRGQGLLDIETEGWFPHTRFVASFTVPGLPGVTCARRFALFDRDGRPALWRGPPTLMESIHTGIDESGGVERLARTEPGRFGWVWI